MKEALGCIGAGRLNKFWTQQGLTEEEKVIQSLYEKLLAPHLTLLPESDKALDCSSPTCETDQSANAEILPDEGALEDDAGNIDVAEDDISLTLDSMHTMEPSGALADCTNVQRDYKRKIDSIDET